MAKRTSRALPAVFSESLFLILTVGVPLALGGVHPPVILAASAGSCLLFFACWLRRRAQGRTLALKPYAWVLVGVAAYTAFQMLPLPMALLQVIAPATADALSVSLAPSAPLWHAISLDPGATAGEAVKLSACALVFIAAEALLRRPERQRRLIVALVACGVAITLLGIVGAVIAPGKPLLFFQPAAGRAGGLIATSFVNPNHAAAFLTLCALLSIGLLHSIRDFQTKALIGLGSILIGSGVILTLSRGGILAFIVGLTVLSILLFCQRRRGTGAVAAVAALTIGIAFALAHEQIFVEFGRDLPFDGELGKLGLWKPGLRIIAANAWVGVGRGAFLTSFPRYLGGEVPWDRTYTHLENQYLHLPAELGVPVAAILLIATVWVLLRWIRSGKRDALTTSAFVALLALGLHAFVDFNLETLGLAFPAAILLAIVAQPKSSSSVPKRPRGLFEALSPAIIVALSIALTLGAAISATRTANEDLDGLSMLAQRTDTPSTRVIAELKRAIRRHPSDPYLHLLGARIALRSSDRSALAWLNRASFLFPGSPMIHRDTAKALRAFGYRRQALLEYRLAISAGAPLRPVLTNALEIVKTHAEIEALVPREPKGYATAILLLLDKKRNDYARSLATKASAAWPKNKRLAMAVIAVSLRVHEFEKATTAAEKLARHSPAPETYLLWAQAAQAPGKSLSILKDARSRFPNSPSVSFRLANRYLSAKKFDDATKAVERILPSTVDRRTLANAHLLLSKIHAAAGRPHRAHYEAEIAKKLR